MSLPKLFTGTSKSWNLLLSAVLIIFVWLCLWYFPWQAKLHHIYWLQLGLGLAIFIIPGACVYGLLSDRPQPEFNHVTFGFVISHLIFAFLGTVGRFAYLSFETIKFLVMILGLMLLFIYLLSNVRGGIKFQMNQERWAYILSTLPFLLVSLLVSLIVIQRTLSDDDLTYLAYVTQWQHSTHLDFNDPIFGIPQVVHPRFWLMSTPFAQAFLAEISQLPGILILGGYYEPFLVIISVFCWYELAIALKLSRVAASAAVIFQLSFLILFSEYLHPGAPYFDQLSADKATAAFIIAPIFFQSLLRLLEKATWNNVLLLLLTGLSLSFTHPIILAYSVFIGGTFIILKVNNKGFKNKLMLMLVLIAIMLPQIAIRFAEVREVQSIAFDPEAVLSQSDSDKLITSWGSTHYYGFNPQILTMRIPYATNIPLPEPILEWGWVLIPISAVLFAIKQKNNDLAHFILSCFVLCFLTGFPLTGWIIGYFLNGRMLARSVWLFPFGLSTIYLVSILKNKMWERQYINLEATKHEFALSGRALIILTIFSLALFLGYLSENRIVNFEKFQLKSIRYENLAIAGQALDQQITGKSVVMGSPNINDLIPGISWKSQIITFRIQNPGNMPYFTTVKRETRISDTQQIFSQSTPTEDRMSLLRKYNVRFLLLQRGDLKIFNDLIAGYPDYFKVTEVGGVYLIQIH